MSKRLATWLMVVAPLAALTAACGADERVDPAGQAQATSSTTTTSSSGAGGGGDGGAGGAPVAPKRTVEQRNPFGDVAETDNLLWDGDFEWTSPFSDQYGWLTGPPLSFTLPDVRIGAACRSGVKCVALKKKGQLLGIGVASAGHALRASVWVHPLTGTCDLVTAQLVGDRQDGDPDVSLAPETATPDATGWCKLSGMFEERAYKTYLFVKNGTGDELLVDDAVLAAVPDAGSMKVGKAAWGPPSAEDVAAVAAARADLARLRGPHDPPPNAARRALEAWGARK